MNRTPKPITISLLFSPDYWDAYAPDYHLFKCILSRTPSGPWGLDVAKAYPPLPDLTRPQALALTRTLRRALEECLDGEPLSRFGIDRVRG